MKSRNVLRQNWWMTCWLITALLCGLLLASCNRGKTEVADRALDELIADPMSPIKFDERIGEYQIVFETLRDGRPGLTTYPMRYSPFTGRPLPSGREALFTRPSLTEAKEIQSKLSWAKTLEDVETILGLPDYTVHNGKTFRIQLTYTNLAETVSLVVQEKHDGSLKFLYGAKPK